MAEAALAYGMDEIWFMPSGISYLKEGTGVLDAQKRLEMVRLATKDNKQYQVSTIEIDRGGNTYTYETMEVLKEKYPNEQFYFLLGADSVFALSSWKCPERLFKACEFLAVIRDDMGQWALLEKITELKARFSAVIHIVPMPSVDVASTEIRSFYQNGGKHHRDVLPQVDEYILSNHLYVE